MIDAMTTPAGSKHPAQSVRAAIDAAGLTVTAAAERLGVSRQQLTRLLGEKSSVSAGMALRLEDVLGVPARQILESQLDRDLAAARKLSRKPAPAPQLETVLRTLRRARENLQAAGVDRLYLFGSVARGSASAGSDIDLFFEPAKDASIGLVELGQLKSRIEKLVRRKVDLAPRDGLRPAVLARAARDQVRVF